MHDTSCAVELQENNIKETAIVSNLERDSCMETTATARALP